MRKMFSEGQIKKIVTQGMKDGEIPSTKMEIIGQGTIVCDGMQGVVHISKNLDYSKYNLLMFTIMGSLFIFVSSALVETANGVKSCCSMIYDDNGNSAVIRAKITYSSNDITIYFASSIDFDFEEAPYGILLGVSL